MNKKTALLLIVTLALTAGGYAGWRSWQANRVQNAPSPVAHSDDLDALLHAQQHNALGDAPDNSTDNVDLALRGIDLAKGEDGRETWRLHANWATLRQESGLVEVRAPEIRYALEKENSSDDARFVRVTADMGRVSEQNTRIVMDGNVRAVHAYDVLTGPVAEFRNDVRVLNFPRGGELAGTELSGRADVLRWNLITNILEGENGVEVIWTPGSGQSEVPPAVPAPTPSGSPRR